MVQLPFELWLNITSHFRDDELLQHTRICRYLHHIMLAAYFARYPATSSLLSQGHLYVHENCFPPNERDPRHPSFYTFMTSRVGEPIRALRLASSVGLVKSLTKLTWQFVLDTVTIRLQMKYLFQVLETMTSIKEIVLDLHSFSHATRSWGEQNLQAQAFAGLCDGLRKTGCESLTVITGTFPWPMHEPAYLTSSRKSRLRSRFTDIWRSVQHGTFKPPPLFDPGPQELGSAVLAFLSASQVRSLRLEISHNQWRIPEYMTALEGIHIPCLQELSVSFGGHRLDDDFHLPLDVFLPFFRKHPTITSLKLCGLRDMNLMTFALGDQANILPNLVDLTVPLVHAAALTEIWMIKPRRFPFFRSLCVIVDFWYPEISAIVEGECRLLSKNLHRISDHLQTTLKIYITPSWMDTSKGHEMESYKRMLASFAHHFPSLGALELDITCPISDLLQFGRDTASVLSTFPVLTDVLLNVGERRYNPMELANLGQTIVQQIWKDAEKVAVLQDVATHTGNHDHELRVRIRNDGPEMCKNSLSKYERLQMLCS